MTLSSRFYLYYVHNDIDIISRGRIKRFLNFKKLNTKDIG